MYVSLILVAFAYAFTLFYGIDIKVAYPDIVMDWATEPLSRFIAYIVLYFLSLKDPIIGLGFMIMFVLIHIDYLNLGREPKSLP